MGNAYFNITILYVGLQNCHRNANPNIMQTQIYYNDDVQWFAQQLSRTVLRWAVAIQVFVGNLIGSSKA